MTLLLKSWIPCPKTFPTSTSSPSTTPTVSAFYHTNRRRPAETFVGGEEEAILKGSQPYITTGYGTHGTQRRAFHAVLSKDGHIIGFIMASVFNTYIFEQMQTLFPTYLLAAMVMLVVSVLLSHGLVSLLRDSLMGHHPTSFLISISARMSF